MATTAGMGEVWRHLLGAIESLHLLRQSLESRGKLELASMASDCIRAIESMVELLREADKR